MGVALAAVWSAFFLPWAIAEGVWWLSRRGNPRTRSQQITDISRFVFPIPFYMPIQWMGAGFGIGLVLIAALALAFR